MPLLETKGAASAQGFGLTLQQAAFNYIEDVFSTWLYTGNGSTQTITNGIDLSTKGGLVWIKSRSAGYGHYIFDTNRGALNRLASNGTGAESSISNSLTSFLSNGFSLGSEIGVNESPGNYASWTFRKQPKFFDVVTYTGTGSLRTVAHSLGSVPGTIIVKCTSEARSWFVYHRSLGENKYLTLQTTNAEATDAGSGGVWGGTAPTATEFTVGATAQTNGGSGRTYVAYLFAHDAGGFGLTGTDNVISCGSFTVDGAYNGSVTLGYEPQWVMLKMSSGASNWFVNDNMRSMPAAPAQGDILYPNLSNSESLQNGAVNPTATGFVTQNALNAGTYIYIAIRRGPMKTPTTGTSVYEGTTRTGTGAAASISGLSFPPDAVITRNRDSNGSSRYAVYDKLRGPTIYLDTAATDAEFTVAQSLTSFNQTGESFGTGAISNFSGDPYINWQFRRAPGFFDVVCYTGTGSSSTSFSHNLGVAPELIISKTRSGSTSNWIVTSNFTSTNYLLTALNLTIAGDTFLYTADASISAQPTSTTLKFTGGVPAVNDSGATYVAYLFASCPGVSKVGSYTGTGTTKQIDCGFTGGARFVLIKRTDSTGDWYVWDSARGIVAGNDPYLLLNSTAAEVTNTDWVDTHSPGFELSNSAGNLVNTNGGTYIFLAIA